MICYNVFAGFIMVSRTRGKFTTLTLMKAPGAFWAPGDKLRMCGIFLGDRVLGGEFL